MDDDRTRLVEEVFQRAIDLTGVQRDRFLRDRCGDDETLRDEVEALLRYESEAAPRFLEGCSDDAPHGAEAPDLVGERIGGFVIQRLIAAGGMGSVYEARQEEPQRTVALKVMRRGIASRTALRRFQYETQLLARLRHPGIAQVYEAGSHDDGAGGVPYFAMEFIPDAAPITEYARSANLPTRRRLALFIEVCDAVHHGHQKGVIHRDLKPSNILVDSSGRPKIIDFGVARSTDSDMAITTLQTSIGQLIGTLQYMSPEQCAADPSDLDIRSDVYSLGVVLYELLCGRTPYDLSHAPVYEATRIIREDNPTRPSAIDRTLRGDLETVVLKALQKDRNRRYESASGLAADIRRFMNHEPITARPPRIVYQLSRFARRNRALVCGVAAAFIVLVLGILATTWQAVQARRAANEANAVSAFLADILPSGMLGDPVNWASRGNNSDRTIGALLDDAVDLIDERFAGQPKAEATVCLRFSGAYWGIGRYRESEALAQRAHDLRAQLYGEKDVRTLECKMMLAEGIRMRLRADEAVPMLREVRRGFEAAYGERDPRTLRATIELAAALVGRRATLAEGVDLARRTLPVLDEEFGPDAFQNRLTQMLLSQALADQGETVEAARVAKKVIDTASQVGPRADYPAAACQSVLGRLAWRRGDLEEAESLFAASAEELARTSGETHPWTVRALLDQGDVLNQLGEFEHAEGPARTSLAVHRRVYDDTAGPTLRSLRVLAWSLMQQRRFDEAEVLYRELIAALVRDGGASRPAVWVAQVNLTWCLIGLSQLEEAEQLASEAVEGFQSRSRSSADRQIASLGALAMAYRRTGRSDEAGALYRQMLAFRDDETGAPRVTALRAMSLLARQMWQRGQVADAEPIARLAVDRFRRGESPPTMAVIISLDTHAVILRDLGRLDEAEGLFREMTALWEQTQPAERAMDPSLQLHYGDCLLRRGRYGEAEPILLESHEMLRATRGDLSVRTRQARRCLADLYHAWDKPAEAARWRDGAMFLGPVDVQTGGGASR